MAVAFEYVVVIILASILVILIVVFFLASLIFLKKRRILCFKRDDSVKPYARTDHQLEVGYGGARGKKPKGKRFSPLRSNEYQRLGGRSPSDPKHDPFANALLANPMVDEEELNMDWSNPTFDTEKSQQYDAAITLQSWYRMRRKRVPFVQLRQAVVLIQALYRGWKVRKMLPQLKKEKQQRDQQRKKQASWKRKGTLGALKFYDVKGYGFAEVEQLYGLETIRTAADQLKKLYGGKGKMRLKLFISVKGIKLFDFFTMEHFATVKVPSISFCSLDPKNKKIFAFINRKKRRNFCHIFQATEQDAQKMVETTSEAFDVTFRRMELRRAQREHTQMQMERDNARLAQFRKKDFHRRSQELDVEVASMLEMAEPGSTHSLHTHSHQLLHTAEVMPGPAGSPHGRPGPAGSPHGRPGPAGSPHGRPGSAGSPHGRPGPAGSPLGRPGSAGSPRGRPSGNSKQPAPQERPISSRQTRTGANSTSESDLLISTKRNGSSSGSGSPDSGSTNPLKLAGKRSRSNSSTGGSGSGLLLARKASPRTLEEGQPHQHLVTKRTGLGSERNEDLQKSTL